MQILFSDGVEMWITSPLINPLIPDLTSNIQLAGVILVRGR